MLKLKRTMCGKGGRNPRPNFGVKLMRPGFGPAAELPTVSPASWRHGGCRSPLGFSNVVGGNRRAASASARETGRTAYTKDVRPTNQHLRGGTFSMRAPRTGTSSVRSAGRRLGIAHC